MGNEIVAVLNCVSLTYPDGVVGIAVPRWGKLNMPADDLTSVYGNGWQAVLPVYGNGYTTMSYGLCNSVLRIV